MFPENFNNEAELGRELLIAKYKNFALENFLDMLRYDSDIEEFLRNTTRHYSLNLPIDLNEYLLNENTVTYLWLSSHPALSAAEDLFKLDKPDTATVVKQSNSLAEIKKFYSNWLLQKNEKEKQYFALSIINLIEKDTFGKDYTKQFILATVLAYERTINSPERAVQVLYKNKENIETHGGLNPELRKELVYLSNLYIGFVYLKEGAINEADQKFYEALAIKSNGITAMLFAAKTQLILGNHGKTLDFITGLISYDKKRFKYAIQNNNLVMFNFFLTNAVIYSIFTDDSFAILLNELDFLLKTFISSDATKIEVIVERLEHFSELPIKDFYNEDITKNLKFIEKYLEIFKNNKNLLLTFVTQFLAEKLNLIINKVIDNIKNYHYDKVKDALSLYTDEIEKNQQTIRLLQNELEENKNKANKRVEDRIKLLENESTKKIETLERRIENLDQDTKFNPGAAFNNAMMYNIIISLIIFIIGGFGAGLGSGSTGEDAFNSIFTSIVISGIKWGGIAFLLGLIAAFISATSTIWERSNEKSRLIKQISTIQIYRDKQKEELKLEFDKYIKQIEKNFSERIKSLEANIERINKEKMEKSKELYDQANDKVKDISIYLEALKFPTGE